MAWDQTMLPAEVATAIKKLKDIPALAVSVIRLETDGEHTVSFRQAPKGVVPGGQTEFPDLGGNNALVNYNLEDANAEAAAMGLDCTLEQLIAHELGHAYYHFYVDSDDKEGTGKYQSGLTAVAWENHLRPSGQKRPYCHARICPAR